MKMRVAVLSGIVLASAFLSVYATLPTMSPAELFLHKITSEESQPLYHDYHLEEGRTIVAGVLDHILPKVWSRIYSDPSDLRAISFKSQKLTFYIHLHECRIDELRQVFEEITDPEHPKFQKYMTKKEIEEFVTCEQTPDNIKLIVAWLKSHQVFDDEMEIRYNHIKIHASVKTIESLFQAEFFKYEHRETKKILLRPHGLITIPDILANSIRMVTGLTEFIHDFKAYTPAHSAPVFNNITDPYVTPRLLRALYDVPSSLRVGSAENNSQGIAAFDDYFFGDDLCKVHELFGRPLEGNTDFASYPDVEYNGPPVGAENGESDLDTQYITLLGSGIPTVFYNHPPESWILAWALEAFSITTDKGPWVWSISYGWPEDAQCDDVINPTLCSNLGHDWIKYIESSDSELMKLGLLGASILVSSGDDGAPGFSIYCPVEPNLPNQLGLQNCLGLDSCDCASLVVDVNDGKSLCILPLGLTWTADPLVPHSSGADCLFFEVTEDTANSTDLLIIQKAALDLITNLTDSVDSDSLCENEFDPSIPAFVSTCSCENVPVLSKEVILSNGQIINVKVYGYQFDESYSPSVFLSDYPAASRYVLSVGATQVIPQFDGKCVNSEEVSDDREVATDLLLGAFDAGGGFSLHWPRPSWQEAVVAEYLEQEDLLPPKSVFKSENRGYPDVSFNGHQYIVVVNGSITPIDGTSASAPALAGLISQLNDFLLRNGKPPLGFLPPLFYKAAQESSSTFRKINATILEPVEGLKINTADNSCSRFGCCKYSFKGSNAPHLWDPVTGLGTPYFPELFKFIRDIHKLPEPTKEPESPKDKSDGVSKGASIGIAVGMFLVGSISAIVIALVVFRRNQREAVSGSYQRISHE